MDWVPREYRIIFPSNRPMRNPFESTGVVIRRDGERSPTFGGTCFAFKKHDWFLTARHVVRDVSARDLGVALYIANSIHDDSGLDVQDVHAHPEADIALLRAEGWGLQIFDPFQGISESVALGEPLRSFGYPSETSPAGEGVTPRMLRGYLQRRFRHLSHLGYSYPALEMSSAAPAGLSGAPVSLDSEPSHVIGLVAETLESRSVLHEISEVEEDGQRFVERLHSIVSYGIAVDLRPHRDWIMNIIESRD